MTAVVILNIVFSAFAVVGMLSLLGRAIVADRRAAGREFGRSRSLTTGRPRFGGPSLRRGSRLDPAL